MNKNNKSSNDMKTNILNIVHQLKIGSITTDEAKDKLLLLFSVVGRSEQLVCEHEWTWEDSNNQDCMKRRCERCGKREAN